MIRILYIEITQEEPDMRERHGKYFVLIQRVGEPSHSIRHSEQRAVPGVVKQYLAQRDVEAIHIEKPVPKDIALRRGMELTPFALYASLLKHVFHAVTEARNEGNGFSAVERVFVYDDRLRAVSETYRTLGIDPATC